jgi:hypothetical protein
MPTFKRTWAAITGQAEERRQSQGLLIHHQTAVFHTLHFLREDGRELYAKHLHQLRDRYP